jgi:hypothetical protein
MEMLYIKENVFGVRDGAPLTESTHTCLVALAAHIALAAAYTLAVAYRMQYHRLDCLQSSL